MSEISDFINQQVSGSATELFRQHSLDMVQFGSPEVNTNFYNVNGQATAYPLGVLFPSKWLKQAGTIAKETSATTALMWGMGTSSNSSKPKNPIKSSIFETSTMPCSIALKIEGRPLKIISELLRKGGRDNLQNAESLFVKWFASTFYQGLLDTAEFLRGRLLSERRLYTLDDDGTISDWQDITPLLDPAQIITVSDWTDPANDPRVEIREGLRWLKSQGYEIGSFFTNLSTFYKLYDSPYFQEKITNNVVTISDIQSVITRDLLPNPSVWDMKASHIDSTTRNTSLYDTIVDDTMIMTGVPSNRSLDFDLINSTLSREARIALLRSAVGQTLFAPPKGSTQQEVHVVLKSEEVGQNASVTLEAWCEVGLSLEALNSFVVFQLP